jgi:Uma2 family endonuclease
MAYVDGLLELMSPSKTHERIKSYIGRLVETYALENGIDFSPYGSWTLKDATREAGGEPDECYLIGPDQERGKPDLVIEVVWTTGGLDKLEIYSRLRVGEFWQWKNGRIDIYLLRRDRYEKAARSAVLPGLDLALLASLLDRPSAAQAIRAYRSALRRSSRRRRPAT